MQVDRLALERAPGAPDEEVVEEVAAAVQRDVSVENLLDEDYFNVPGFVTPGSMIVVGLRLQRP